MGHCNELLLTLIVDEMMSYICNKHKHANTFYMFLLFTSINKGNIQIIVIEFIKIRMRFSTGGYDNMIKLFFNFVIQFRY